MLKLTVDTQGVRFSGKQKRAALRAAKAAVKVEGKKGECRVSLLVTDDATIAHLNKVYRGIDKTTDVLSFPSDEDVFLGDIGLSIERARSQANEYGHSVEREVAFLVAHSMLHLFGPDHMEERGEARMREKQREIMREAGYEIE